MVAGGKGVYRAESLLGCSGARLAVYKLSVCLRSHWLLDATEEPRSASPLNPVRYQRRELPEIAVNGPESAQVPSCGDGGASRGPGVVPWRVLFLGLRR